MDILFLVENGNLHGGTEILTFNLLHALRDAGEDVWVLSLEPYKGSEEYVISLAPEEYARWKNSACSWGNKLAFSIKSDRILHSILTKKFKELKPAMLVNQTYDIITALPVSLPVAQVFNWSVVGYEASLKSLIRKKDLIGRMLSGFCEWGRRIRRHRMLACVPKLVVLTEAAKEELKSLNGKIRDEQLVVIPDPLTVNEDSSVYTSLTNGNVAFVGRLSHEKGVMRLLRIWERVSHEIPNFTLSIYGEGDQRGEMEAYIRERNLRNVVFCGYCNDLERIYLHSDLLLMTSDTEGFGMVLIEAMYYGVPCVSFDCPVSPKEVIGDAGIVVPCYDEKQYTEEVIALLKNKKRLFKMQNKSVNRVRAYYLNIVINKWLNII